MKPALFILLAAASCAAQKLDPVQLRASFRTAPRLPGRLQTIALDPQLKLGMISSVAVGQDGNLYVLQRGTEADPIIVLDAQGRVLRSWGKGLFEIPHSIRVDPQGHVWTADAATSKIFEFDSAGKKLLQIEAGGLPPGPPKSFLGTTDIAFDGAGRRIFVSDGYRNTRILEFSPGGRLVREWGRPGSEPGELHLPHGIAIDGETIFVADRENWRIQRFTLDGKYLGEWNHLGKTFSLKIDGGDLWLMTQPGDVANGIEPWIVRVDKATGKIKGVAESRGVHSIDVMPGGHPVAGGLIDGHYFVTVLR